MTETMARETAQNYRDTITADCEAGYPFGYDEDRTNYGEEAELTAYDWLEDALDIEYRVSSEGEYRSARVLIGWGGPNVWVDTARHQIQVSWYSPLVELTLPDEFIDGLNEALEEIWGTR